MKRIVIAVLLLAALCYWAAGEVPVYHEDGYNFYKFRGSAYIWTYDKDADQLTVPDTLGGCTVTEISASAFYNCKSLISVALPDCISRIDANPFYACRELVKISVAPGSEHFAVVDGVLFTKDGTQLIAYPAAMPGYGYEVPAGTKTIGAEAFRGCRMLESVTIPDSVTTVGYSAFEDCGQLKEIVLPDSVTTVGDSAFNYCEQLKEIVLPKRVTEIGSYTFSLCKSLADITLPGGVTKIGDSAFSFCESLAGITLPDGITRIDRHAFYMCKSLRNITLPESIAFIGSNAFYGCDKLTAMVTRGSYAMKYCENNGIKYICSDE